MTGRQLMGRRPWPNWPFKRALNRVEMVSDQFLYGPVVMGESSTITVTVTATQTQSTQFQSHQPRKRKKFPGTRKPVPQPSVSLAQAALQIRNFFL